MDGMSVGPANRNRLIMFGRDPIDAVVVVALHRCIVLSIISRNHNVRSLDGVVWVVQVSGG